MATSKNKPDSIDESEFLQNTNPAGAFDPINSEKVKDNPEKRAQVVGDTSKQYIPAPEAVYQGQTINLDEETQPLKGESKANSTAGASPDMGNQGQNFTRPEAESYQFNEEFGELPKAEQDESAAMTADAVIHAYSSIKMAIPSMIAVSERKIKKLHQKGEINMYQPVRLNRNTNQTISTLDFVKRFNESIVEPFKTREEFKEAVKPLLIHIFKKKGFAPTPEQLLMFYVAQDLVITTKAAVEAGNDRRELLAQLKENYTGFQGTPVTQPQSPDVPKETFAPAATPQQPVATPQQSVSQAEESKEIVKRVIERATKKKRKTKKRTPKKRFTPEPDIQDAEVVN